ncbi:hypothetical protein HELRODRAFT_160493 [Helobdella robusta]|uniref:Integrator complex subunit 2 n=1 Tax=Helobdella robusta TaxID=6412 RepID=T1EQB3_HELRO|nr:hypothetical protein HELRODRAFT_160493 [Helobdella robusta]ESO06329.1 hypothetical protein HELRODRAFT_160493 [Helobdella robusta]
MGSVIMVYIPYTTTSYPGIQNVDIEMLSMLPEQDLRPILPCLVRMSLCSPLDNSSAWTAKRKLILKCLSGIEIVNNLVSLLSIDFHDLEIATKDRQLKLGNSSRESLVNGQVNQGLALEFERSEAPRKLRFLLSEMLSITAQVADQNDKFLEKSSELFETEIYLDEVSDVLCITQAELPHLLPMLQVAEALLHVKNGSWLLCRLVANTPESFLDVCRHLVSLGPRQDFDSVESQRRCDALLALCDICPSHMLTVRSMCLENCKLPDLALQLTLNYNEEHWVEDSLQNILTFMCGILLDSDLSSRSWFSQYIRLCDKKKDFHSAVSVMREKLLNEMCISLLSAHELTTDDMLVKACSIIRLYSTLKCVAGLKFSEKENSTLLKLVLKKSPTSKSGMRFISLGLCMLLACPHLLVTDEEEKNVISWLKWLLDISDDYEILYDGESSFGEMLLLLAIHFHSGQNNAISELVSATLGIKCPTKASALMRLKSIFTVKVFNEQVVAAHAIKVQVTKNLSRNIKGFLPIHCIYQLLKSRTFSKYKISIKDWISKQMRECKFPIHPILRLLIDAYVNSILLPSTKSDRSNEPISETNLANVFQKDSYSLPVKLVHLYYVMFYQDVLMTNMNTLQSSNRPFVSYSSSFVNNIPVKFLMQSAQTKSSQMAGMFSNLLGLVAIHQPHLCNAYDWLCCQDVDDSLTTNFKLDKTSKIVISPESLQNALKLLPFNYSQCCLILEELSTYQAAELINYKEIFINDLLLFLDDCTPRRCQDLILIIWNTLNSYCPDLKTLTVNALSYKTDNLGTSYYKEEDLVTDPLIVLRCDTRVFRCPPLMEVLLLILNCFLHMSKTFLSNHIFGTPVLDSNKVTGASDREELRVALVAAQESAALQILLESCLPLSVDQEKNELLLSNKREVQCLVCSHIHQKFISDPSLAKLIHFQGYPLQLIPITVAGISSMHICLDFLPELIAQPQHNKQCFAIKLVSYLSLQYPVPKSLSVARLCVNVMKTLLSVLTSEQRPAFYVSTLPDLVRFCTAFPVITDDTLHFLNQLGAIVRSEIAVKFDSLNSMMILSNDGCEDFDEHSTYTNNLDSAPVNDVMLYKRILKTFDEVVGATNLLKSKLKT